MSGDRIGPEGLIDFHCHLDLYPDHERLIAECERRGIRTLGVTTTPKAWPRNHELTSPTRFVRSALGLHPQLVEERADELPLFEQYLPEARYVGEVGLDAGPRFYRSLDLQKEVFSEVLRLSAQHGGKILTIHSVRAVPQVLDLLEALLPADRGKVVLHWFTGSKKQAQRAIEFGCYFSINAEMMKSEMHRQTVRLLPVERLLTETDGPFVEFEGRPVRPTDVAATTKRLAETLSISIELLSDQLKKNLRALVE